jgi:hypothetical protein
MTTSPAVNKRNPKARQARRATGWLALAPQRFIVLPAAVALAAGLLIGATTAGSAAEMIQSPDLPTTASQPADAGPAEPEAPAASTAPANAMVPPAGTVGFGWG